MADVLFVGKPVEPPWNDSSKNLAKDLAFGLTRHRPTLLTAGGLTETPPHVRTEALYGGAARGFSPALAEKVKLLARIGQGREPLAHFFFAPNRASSTAARAVVRLRGKASVHTLCSAPADGADLRSILFADVNVVLSRSTERRLRDAGIPESRVRRIGPAIAPIDPPADAERHATRRAFALPTSTFLVVYPGDLEFGRGADVLVEAIASSRREITLAMACRTKTPEAKRREAELRALATTLGADTRVHWIGETRRIHALLGAADLVALPSDTLYAKMDYPLVLLEAMSQERAVLVGQGTAAEELAEGGAALASRCQVDDVLAAIESVEADVVSARALGRVGRARVLAAHSVEAMAAAYESLYDHLLGSH